MGIKEQLRPLHHNLGGPTSYPLQFPVQGRSLGAPPCGGYVFKQDFGPYLLCIFVVGVKADTPPELRPEIGKGSYLLCKLGTIEAEAVEELNSLTTTDVRIMAEAMLGPWAAWI